MRSRRACSLFAPCLSGSLFGEGLRVGAIGHDMREPGKCHPRCDASNFTAEPHTWDDVDRCTCTCNASNITVQIATLYLGWCNASNITAATPYMGRCRRCRDENPDEWYPISNITRTMLVLIGITDQNERTCQWWEYLHILGGCQTH